MRLLIFVTLLILHLANVNSDKSDVGLNPGEIIANHGYPSETHQVTTDDGYIVTLYRIPHGINENSTTGRHPVYLMHGINLCAGEFVSLGPKLGLAYILADAGYDVWLGNARGTLPSRGHVTIDVETNPEAFFNFTWHEIGYYDVANSIDYILEQSGEESLYYIGHSQGTTVFLVLASTRPEYNRKIRLASLMAPAAILQHYPSSLIQTLCKHVDKVWNLVQGLKVYEVPLVTILRKTVIALCRNYPEEESNPICELLHNSVLSNVDKDVLPVALSNCPNSAALKEYVHFGQLVRDGGFRQFDYGREINMEVYGTETPPDYDLSKISAPIAFYYANKDHIVTVEDERTLVSMVPNAVSNYLVPDENFGHLDFAMHNRVVELVYEELLSLLLLFR